MARVLLFLIIGIAFFSLGKELLVNKEQIAKKRVIVLIAAISVLFLVAFLNIKVNGTCLSGQKNEQLVPGVKEAYCKRTCYCDGVSIKNMCLGVWRSVCPIDR